MDPDYNIRIAIEEAIEDYATGDYHTFLTRLHPFADQLPATLKDKYNATLKTEMPNIQMRQENLFREQANLYTQMHKTTDEEQRLELSLTIDRLAATRYDLQQLQADYR
ncbi:MAG: hypothetical protein ACQESG_07125 [Nanobdellota archaeon]